MEVVTYSPLVFILWFTNSILNLPSWVGVVLPGRLLGQVGDGCWNKCIPLQQKEMWVIEGLNVFAEVSEPWPEAPSSPGPHKAALPVPACPSSQYGTAKATTGSSTHFPLLSSLQLQLWAVRGKMLLTSQKSCFNLDCLTGQTCPITVQWGLHWYLEHLRDF